RRDRPRLHTGVGWDRKWPRIVQGASQGSYRNRPADRPGIVAQGSARVWPKDRHCREIVEGLSRMGEKGPVATPSATQELEALERGRLEAVLASDENGRALRRGGAGGAGLGGRAARQARNARLEMALAGNAPYQAWKHLNGAITALRARHADPSHLEDGGQPLPTEPARTGGPVQWPAVAAGPPPPPPPPPALRRCLSRPPPPTT